MSNAIRYQSGMAFVGCSCGHELNLHYVSRCKSCDSYICSDCKMGGLCKRCHEAEREANKYVGFDIAEDQSFWARVEVQNGEVVSIEKLTWTEAPSPYAPRVDYD